MSDQPYSDPIGQPGSPNDPFQAAKASAMRAAEELRQATTQKASEIRTAATERAQQLRSTATERSADFREYADQALHDARDRYADIRVEGEKFVREKPAQAVMTAFGVGLFIGLILRR
jgi:ElaB/YqjD/DUF883 family membrane-anchored ribosome-binding protein